MKRCSRLLAGVLLLFVTHTLNGSAPGGDHAGLTRASTAQRRNEITGFVFGESRRPVADVVVELLDELNVTINRTRTNASGRYAFHGLSDGRFKVRVLPYGTDYDEQTQEVILRPVSAIPGSGSDNQQVDFYLRAQPGAGAGPFYAPGEVFAQEVPDEARRHYARGVEELRARKEKEGFESLRRALEIFPDYYLALDRLGTEYAARGVRNSGYFEAARVLLTKALEVNPRSFSSAFGLGLSHYHLGLTDRAVENLERAARLYDKSVNAHLWLGVALKRAGKLPQAEAALKRADRLGEGKVAEAHMRLAEIYGEQKRYAEAADELELFLKHQKDARDAEKIRQLIAQLRTKAAGAR
jgi:Tfp pilus assembly protein PilF